MFFNSPVLTLFHLLSIANWTGFLGTLSSRRCQLTSTFLLNDFSTEELEAILPHPKTPCNIIMLYIGGLFDTEVPTWTASII